MASILSCHGTVILFLTYLGICYTKCATANGGRPRLHIFHHSCALKKDEGPCKAVKERFYFNTDTGYCENFEYGGCQGNANNFETLEACEEMCVVRANKSPCHLEDEPGPCRGLVPRFFFDNRTQECRRFFYGGCFGNANNFKTIQACRDRCQPGNNTHVHAAKPKETVNATREALIKEVFTGPVLCLSAIDEGHCDGEERRFAYNHSIKRCQVFYYSGCGGNKNNFVLKKDCIRMCMKGNMKDHGKKNHIRIKTRKSHILRSI
ncbi:tissue factor pathway inhibitor a isoform X1 [Electrophorus electricus]|uniref:Tissue factor pathway inhibitor n=1 Tax=Electrophorus electricus TaxID=8005 RepID=A0A4W4EF73_ELEEL|nr:tissue factor pathway inhibitor a isoform X1 [Electrophorus electricus]